jgi:hypothetical protein
VHLNTDCLTHWKIPGVVKIISNRFCTFCKMWLSRLGFVYGSCMMVLYHISVLQFGNSCTCVSGRMDRTGWTNIMACPFEVLAPGRHLKSTVYDTEVSKVQDLQQRIQNGSQAILRTLGIFQGVRPLCSEKVNVKVGALSVFFNLQKAAILKPCFRRPNFVDYFCLLL